MGEEYNKKGYKGCTSLMNLDGFFLKVHRKGQGVGRELWERGLRQVLLFITDGLPGIEEAIRRVYPLAD